VVLVRMQLIGRAALALAALAVIAALATAPADGRANAQVSLNARPTTLGWSQTATLFGAVDSREADQRVTIEAKRCPLTSFTEVAVVVTGDGGNFNTTFGAGVNTTIRAVWRNATSAPVELRQTPRLQLDKRGRNRFEVGVASQGQLWRKKVQVQRRAGGKWVNVKTVVLSDTQGSTGQAFVWIEAEFQAKVPRRSSVRAVLPASQARPCYLAAVSNTVRA
jgi:hypothetical protein